MKNESINAAWERFKLEVLTDPFTLENSLEVMKGVFFAGAGSVTLLVEKALGENIDTNSRTIQVLQEYKREITHFISSSE